MTSNPLDALLRLDVLIAAFLTGVALVATGLTAIWRARRVR